MALGLNSLGRKGRVINCPPPPPPANSADSFIPPLSDGVVTKQEQSANFWDCSDPYIVVQVSLYSQNNNTKGFMWGKFWAPRQADRLCVSLAWNSEQCLAFASMGGTQGDLYFSAVRQGNMPNQNRREQPQSWCNRQSHTGSLKNFPTPNLQSSLGVAACSRLLPQPQA